MLDTEYKAAVVRQIVALKISGLIWPVGRNEAGVFTWSMDPGIETDVLNLIQAVKEQAQQMIIEQTRPEGYTGDDDGETPEPTWKGERW